MILADFNSGAILISFGALVGRLSGDQLLVMAFFETIFFCINEAIAVHKYEVADIGGSMIIHTFGAYFGLAVSAVLESGNAARTATLEKFKSFNGSDKTSDTFAMI
jgi:ammonium transporter Rh